MYSEVLAKKGFLNSGQRYKCVSVYAYQVGMKNTHL